MDARRTIRVEEEDELPGCDPAVCVCVCEGEGEWVGGWVGGWVWMWVRACVRAWVCEGLWMYTRAVCACNEQRKLRQNRVRGQQRTWAERGEGEGTSIQES